MNSPEAFLQAPEKAYKQHFNLYLCSNAGFTIAHTRHEDSPKDK
jgi:hypothetical protein